MKQSPDVRQFEKILVFLKVSASLFILVGLCIFFNAGGIGDIVFSPDALMQKIGGIAFIGVGLVDIFILPLILTKNPKR